MDKPRPFYLTIDSAGCEWNFTSGIATLTMSSPIFMLRPDINSWYVSLIDYRPPLTDKSGPAAAYLVANFIDNQFINDRFARKLATIHLAMSELQRSHITGHIWHPVPCLVVQNPLSKLTIEFLGLNAENSLKFLRSDFYLLLKFEVM